jgi:hypothetical protein
MNRDFNAASPVLRETEVRPREFSRKSWIGNRWLLGSEKLRDLAAAAGLQWHLLGLSAWMRLGVAQIRDSFCKRLGPPGKT